MAQSLLLLLLLTTASTIPFLAIADSDQCGGGQPMESVSTFLGADIDYDLADQICCHNHMYAEPSGYQTQSQVDLFSRLDSTDGAENIFYDSVCGIPLFIAPRGRTFDEFKEESIHHGWPSFRPQEMVSENIKIYNNGRMESKCGTHLGHNLPEGGVDRYCIDLVCVAGVATSDYNHLITGGDDVITASEFEASTYESSAEDWSGKHPYTKRKILTFTVVAIALLALVGYFVHSARKTKRNYRENQEFSNIENNGVRV